MEAVCSTHPSDLPPADFLQRGRIRHIPKALLDQLDVSGEDDFQPCLLHTNLVTSESFRDKPHARITGSLVFQDPRTKRIATLPFASDTMLVDGTVYAWTRLTFDGWS